MFIRRASEGVREEKLLATELLCTYSKYFPDLVDNVVDKLIDLCEEDDLDVGVLCDTSLTALGTHSSARLVANHD